MSSFDAAERFRSRTLTASVIIGTDPDLDRAVQDAAALLNKAMAGPERKTLSTPPVDAGEIERLRTVLEQAVAARDASGLTVHLVSRGQQAYLDVVNQARAKDLSLGHMQYETARMSFDKVTADGADTGLTWDDLDHSATGPEMDAVCAAAVSLYRSADAAPFERRGTSSASS